MPRSKWPIDIVALLIAGLLFALFLGVGLSSSSINGLDANDARAQLRCVELAQAIERYVEREENAKHELPQALNDLAHPPFGGLSLLRGGEADLLDPWGKPFEMERVRRADGTEFILVKTTAPDGTPISQFGIGKNTVPK